MIPASKSVIMKNQFSYLFSRRSKKRSVAALSLVFLFSLVNSNAQNQGVLDNTFGNKGVATPVITGDEGSNDHFVYSNGKILQLTQFNQGGMAKGLMLLKYNSNGTLDNTFG